MRLFSVVSLTVAVASLGSPLINVASANASSQACLILLNPDLRKAQPILVGLIEKAQTIPVTDGAITTRTLWSSIGLLSKQGNSEAKAFVQTLANTFGVSIDRIEQVLIDATEGHYRRAAIGAVKPTQEEKEAADALILAMFAQAAQGQITYTDIFNSLLKLDGAYKSSIALLLKDGKPELATKTEQDLAVMIRQAAQPAQAQTSAGAKDSLGLTVDLSQRAREGRLGRAVGRSAEVDRVINLFNSQGKKNPLLIGAEGVGRKTVLYELIHRVNEGKVESLAGVTFHQIDLGALVAGSQMRGELEQRVKDLIRQLEESKGSKVLVIDGVEQFKSANGDSATKSIADMIKKAMQDGRILVVGLTTQEGYMSAIDKDSLMKALFEEVPIEAPSKQLLLSILRDRKKALEHFYGITISDEAITFAAAASSRYLGVTPQPTASLQLIDTAARMFKAQMSGKSKKESELEDKLLALNLEKESLEKTARATDQARINAINVEIQSITPELQSIEREMTKFRRLIAIQDEIFTLKNAEGITNETRASNLTKIEALTIELEGLRASMNLSDQQTALLGRTLGSGEIATAIEALTGVVASKASASEAEKLLGLEVELGARVIGQDHAKKQVANTVRAARAGLNDPKRPIGSFIFTGPSGVGKTELAKALAEFLFDSEDALIRLDMSEFKDEASVTKMVGASPGYVGYEEGGQLTNKVLAKPYSVILLDEIEKAHPAVWDLLLQVLDEGRLTDGQGRTVDFKNTIIVITSNADREIPAEVVGDEFTERLAPLINARVEALGRVDSVLRFQNFTQDEASQILKLHLGAFIKKRVNPLGIEVDVSDAAFNHMLAKGFSEVTGARPLKAMIEKEIRPLIAELILQQQAGRIGSFSRVKIDFDGAKFTIESN